MKAQNVLVEFHEGICRGHFAPTAITHIIMRVGYYWPTIFKDSYEMIRKCISCKRFSRKMKREAMSLQYVIVEETFVQWGLDVIGPINLKSSKSHFYIIIGSDYFTKWREVVVDVLVATEGINLQV
jgi:hypothetical protein